MLDLTGLAALSHGWSEELSRALIERTAWAHLGTVEVTLHRGMSTLGGYIDRRTIPIPAGDSVNAVQLMEAWRRTADGRLVDRALVQANSMLHARLGPPERVFGSPTDPWLEESDAASTVDAGGTAGAIVVLGAASDLVAVTRATRQAAAAPRLHACPTDARPGIVSVVTGVAPPCTFVAMIAVSPGPDGLHVITVVDVRTQGPSRLRRSDVPVA